jgi:hypothetical protein
MRSAAALGVFLVFVVAAGIFLAYRAWEIIDLQDRGLRSDALGFITLRDVSLTFAMVSGGGLLASFLGKGGVVSRMIVGGLLLLSLCVFGLSATAEWRLRTSVQNNLEQLKRALENYHQTYRSSASSSGEK